ncbi:MAG TPA: dipeptidase, partial [Candidatus Acidoferrales bacterium]
MHKLFLSIAIVSFVWLVACGRSTPPQPEESLADRARRIHMAALVVDTHADTPTRMMYDDAFDIGRRDAAGHIDIPRMREGGLDAVFFSIWTPATTTGRAAVDKAARQIELVRAAAEKYPQDLVVATTVSEIRRAHEQKKIAALLGLEGGHMINDSLDQLRKFAAAGVRYMTLTHSKNTNWADSSGDTPKHNGLTAFGKEIVREMNKLGVMVDISHVSDKAFADVLETTRAPVIASHSSCRALASHARNMTDDMIRALAANGGVMMINYHVQFLDEANYAATQQNKADWDAVNAAILKKCGDNVACAIFE